MSPHKFSPQTERFLTHAGCRLPVVCGAMYPCSNPELLTAVVRAGGLAVVQPISMIYAHGVDLREGIRQCMQASRDGAPGALGFNAIIEKSSKRYEARMRDWVDIALDEGVRFFVTALGAPDWVVEAVHARGGFVYHDVTARRWAERAARAGVDGFICVNARAGGHAGDRTPEQLHAELVDLGKPLICAGGVGGAGRLREALDIGYAGVQMGTRFIATSECSAREAYKTAICEAKAADIVLTERLTGVPVAVIANEYVKRTGIRAGWLGRRALAHPRFKHWARAFYSLRSIWQLRGSVRPVTDGAYESYWQAGRSVESVDSVCSVAALFEELEQAFVTPVGECRSDTA